MAYINSDTQKDKILRNDRKKLKEEISAQQKSLGLRGMVPRHNQDEYRQLEDINNESNHILETMQKAREERIKRQAEERKAKRKHPDELLKIYLKKKERESRMDYESRKIVYNGGEFSGYEETIKMMPSLVLLKEIRKDNIDGVALPETFKDKLAQYQVICCGDECYDLNKDDVVMVEPYSGIEIESKKDIYRIVLMQDILIKVE